MKIKIVAILVSMILSHGGVACGHAVSINSYGADVAECEHECGMVWDVKSINTDRGWQVNSSKLKEGHDYIVVWNNHHTRDIYDDTMVKVVRID